MTDKYDQLKSVIQAANPEIMELKFGCEVISGKTRMTIISSNDSNETLLWDFNLNQPYHNSGSTIYDRILGRPIRLTDVLLAIDLSNDIKGDWSCTATGAFEEWVNPTSQQWELKTYTGAGFWNLKDDNLDHQSEETKQFLINLLA